MTEEKIECKHKISERQAVGVGIDQYNHSFYGVVCLRCGKLLFSGIIKRDSK